MLLQYSHTPGAAGGSPSVYPAASSLPLDPKVPTLMMFLHAQCPCSRASVGELERIVARCSGRFVARVIFVQPEGLPEADMETDLWKSAMSIPGIQVLADGNGGESRRFCAETSGHTVVYAPNGQLLFQGGITHSRGHAGDNAGRDAAIAAVETATPDLAKTPVFGCALGMDQAQPEGTYAPGAP